MSGLVTTLTNWTLPATQNSLQAPYPHDNLFLLLRSNHYLTYSNHFLSCPYSCVIQLSILTHREFILAHLINFHISFQICRFPLQPFFPLQFVCWRTWVAWQPGCCWVHSLGAVPYVTLLSGSPADWQLDPEPGSEAGSPLLAGYKWCVLLSGGTPDPVFTLFLMLAAVGAPFIYLLIHCVCKMVIF